LFPRAAAMGERLWSNPSSGFYAAEQRMLEHRRRLVEQRGVNADALQPEWCRQNAGQCYDEAHNPNPDPEDNTDNNGASARTLAAAGSTFLGLVPIVANAAR
jgi:hypothetical protein